MEKARSLVGDGGVPFEAKVEPFMAGCDKSGIRWLAADLMPPVLHRAAELFAAGRTVRQVALLLGLTRSEAGRLRQQAVTVGLFARDPEDEREDV
jgi:hypothetical protein